MRRASDILWKMYIPAHFGVDDEEAALFVRGIRVGDLVTATEDGLLATFLPLIFEPSGGPLGSLCGHVARTNDHWRRGSVDEAVVIAHGPNAYVSPSWYPSKSEHGRVVPTWNYATAHLYGELRIRDDVEWLDALLRRLTDRHESGRAKPWSVEDAPAKFYEGQLRAIVGVELVISRAEVKVKMSQNRPAADIDGVIAGLAEQGDDAASRLVERFRPRPDIP